MNWTTKNKWYLIFFILCFLISIFSFIIFYQVPYFDGITHEYFNYAQNIVDGNGYVETYMYQGQIHTIPGIFRPPAYAYLMAGFQQIFGNNIIGFTLFQILLLSVFVVFFYYAINDIFPKIAKLSTFMLIFFLPLIRLSNFREPGMIVGPLIFMSIYFLYKKKYLLSGMLLALSILFREDAILVLPFILIYIIFEKLINKKNKSIKSTHLGIILFVVGFLVILSPWLIRNYETYHKFPYISTPKAGLTLIAGIGEYDSENRFGLPFYDQDQMKSEGYESWFPNADERDKIRVEKAKKVILENPLWYVGVMIKRIPQLTYYISPGGNHESFKVLLRSFLMGKESLIIIFKYFFLNIDTYWFFAISFIQISIYYLFFFIGLYYLIKKKYWNILILFCIVPFAYMLNISHHVEPRYFMPALYFIIPISAYGIYNLINYLKRKYYNKNGGN